MRRRPGFGGESPAGSMAWKGRSLLWSDSLQALIFATGCCGTTILIIMTMSTPYRFTRVDAIGMAGPILLVAAGYFVLYVMGRRLLRELSFNDPVELQPSAWMSRPTDPLWDRELDT